MDFYSVLTSILSLLAGVGVFLIACTMMSNNLESLGSKRLKSMFTKASNSKLLGVGIGAFSTAVIQSSSATTVMTIGFVNAGIMTLAQAATVIFGANIGTTITGQLVALGLVSSGKISTSVIFATLAGIGAFIMMFTKKDKWQKLGGMLAGFGMLFVGLSLMSDSMESFAQNEEVRNFLAIFTNPFLLVVIGAILTGIIQSSSAMTSMAITMVLTGLISLNQGIYVTMGANVGTCITAIIASMASNRNAKRTSMIHLIFNVSGVALFMIIGLFMRLGGVDFGTIFDAMFPGAPQIQLAMFHTIFNVITVLMVLPLTNKLIKLVTKIIPDKKEVIVNEKPHLCFVDDNMLATPPIAVLQTKNEILNMASIAKENFNLSCKIIQTLDYSVLDKFKANEEALNYINKELVEYIVKLIKCELSEGDSKFLSGAIKTISDIERIGDYAENIVEYAENLSIANMKFSDNAIKEIDELNALIAELHQNVIAAYKYGDIKARDRAYVIEDKVDEVTDQMGKNHITRLREGLCKPEVGAQYLTLSGDVERIADHYINIVETV